MKILKGDKVKVLIGKDKNREGEVVKSFPKKSSVVVKGLNIFKKHVKPSQGRPGSIVEKERAIYIASNEALDALSRYNEVRWKLQPASDFFFVNQRLHRLSEDSIRLFFRRVISRKLRRRITPHMFRHTFASLLLANNVDLKVIQELLGHSSITTTQIYIHLTTGRLKDVLQCSHPRCSMTLQSNASIS